MGDLILAFGGRPPTSQHCHTAGVVTSSDVKVCWVQDIGSLAALRLETSMKAPAHPPRSREQLCPQQSPVAQCHPPCPCHPSCLLEGNLPFDAMQAVLHFLRTVEHRTGGQEGLGRVESCVFAMTLPFGIQLPLSSLGRLGGLWPGQGTRAARMGKCRTLPPRGSGLTVQAMAPSSQRPELLK